MSNEAKAPFGFYELEKIRLCTLSGAAAKVGFGKWVPEDPPTRAVIVGRFYHDLMESEVRNQGNNEDFDFCRSLIGKYKDIVDEHQSLKSLGNFTGWKEINDAARVYLQGSFSGRKLVSSSANSRQANLYSKSNLLIGKPDELKIEGRRAYLTEFKSSAIYKDGQIQERFVRQLKYYAYLVFTNFEIDELEARLISLNGHEALVPITKPDAIEFGAHCEKLAEAAWQQLSNARHIQNLAVPGIPQCPECRVRAACTQFLKCQDNFPELESLKVARGVLNAIEFKGNNAYLKTEDIELVIQNPTKRQIAFLEDSMGLEIVVTNCRGAGRKFETTNRTVFAKVHADV